MKNQKDSNSKEDNKANISSTKENLGFLFNMEILVRSDTNAKALQLLLQTLNQSEHIIDYRVNSGIELGTIIESLLSTRKQSSISRSYERLHMLKEQGLQTRVDSPETSSVPSEQAELTSNDRKETERTELNDHEEFTLWIQKFIIENRLVRLLVYRQGKRVSIPCRILNYMSDTSSINVYHVDEKRVYTFNLNEIIDFVDIHT